MNSRETHFILLCLLGCAVFVRMFLVNSRVEFTVGVDINHQVPPKTPLNRTDMPQSIPKLTEEQKREQKKKREQEWEEQERRKDAILKGVKPLTILLTKDVIRTIEKASEAADQYYRRIEFSETPDLVHPQLKDTLVESFFTKGHWFRPGTKYFVYQPSGGMSNQRIILREAFLAAKALNRTLVVPPVGAHTSMFYNYNGLDYLRTIDPFDVFDKKRLETGVSVLGLSNCILRRFVETNENKYGQSWLRVERDRKGSFKQLTTESLISDFGDVKQDVIFFAKYSMWKGFRFKVSEYDIADRYILLHPEMRRVARIASEKLFDNQKFSAVHIRFEDRNVQYLTDVLGPATSFVRRLIKYQVLADSSNLYVATQPSKIGNAYFNAFTKAGFNLTYSNSLLEVPEVVQFMKRFASTDIYISALGLVEQLVCARGNFFLGTGFSTFSWFIRMKRNSPLLFYDESLVPGKPVPPNATLEDVRELFSLEKTLTSTQQREAQLILRHSNCSRNYVSVKLCQ
uniref:GDP-fucose protein O-fucosyltransferase 2 n=1 Tax=Mucochytrium quahogii TaxID=96639 RepID=A0A7S2RY20_9STRA|mmetsp:Transcript_1733/g.2771  ORF Transcript_1733/g.2771 Transcript_1733/m.2771 type:complete len:514 (+) Transcript_1733:241-1782(+)